MLSTTEPHCECLPLDRLILDPRLQLRSGLADGLTDPTTVARYREVLEDGQTLPPLEVVSDGQSHWLFDGFQRAAACEQANKVSVECLVYAGSFNEALMRALSANARHGLTRTASDCRRALGALLDSAELCQHVVSHAREQGGVYRALARACGVSRGLVSRVLEERNLQVVTGKLVPKPTLSAEYQTSAVPAAEPREVDNREGAETEDAGPAPTAHRVSVAPLPWGSQDSLAELDRARAAIESLWAEVRRLLDGPLNTRFLQLAAHHRIPFSRVGHPECLIGAKTTSAALSSIAWWEPLGNIERVLADLSAAASSGRE